MNYIYPHVKCPVIATLNIPGSKSITNRALLLAALANGTSKLREVWLGDDTKTMLQALQQLGIQINYDGNVKQALVTGCSGTLPVQDAAINCQDAGTVLRFLLAVCAFNKGKYLFTASKQLQQRPIAPLISLLRNLGVTFRFEQAHNQLPLVLTGIHQLDESNIIVPGEQSSQFLSGLLMALPILKKSIACSVENLVSVPYVDMTCEMMASFGIKVQQAGQYQYVVPSTPGYQAADYLIEPDLSTASYFYAAAAMTQGEVKIRGVHRQRTIQGDVAIFDILERMGCKVIDESDGVKVVGSELRGIEINMRDCSDLFMTVACLAVAAREPTVIRGIKHIRFKESNRILAMQENFKKMGIVMEEYDDYVKIIPHQPVSAELSSFLDHRIVMSSALLGLKVPGLLMNEASCVSKTCPDFVSLWEQMVRGRN